MTSPSTQFIFIRHGETDWNRQHRFQGQIDVPLNATGHEQAARLGECLADEAADVLLASDLERARQTAEPLARAWGLPVLAEAGVREQAFGVLEGLDFPTIQREHPQLLAQWIQHRADFAPPGGGESQRVFYQRVSAAVQTLATRHAGRRVVVVTHGGVLDMLWRRAHQQPLDGPRRCDIPNAGLNRLRWHAGALIIERWADDAHLAGLPPQPLAQAARA
ncbi:MAG: phosphoglycerate kinase [Rubrivivax sp. SCN 71-131]|jgi:probable phosphoglycerate mutase|nr:MAG: phosphoglycerate kinase [Rubrivivax sp. SCN 71-131]